MLNSPVNRRTLLATSIAFATAAATRSYAQASDWPSRPIKFIVPYPPGGPTDLMARILAPKLQAALGQSVIVENKGGAAGNVGTDMVAKAPADGYTLLLAASGPMAVNKSLYKTLPFDALKDFAPITQISSFPLVLEVHPSFPAQDLKGFIAYLKANPGKVSFASAGSGTPQHLAGELLKAVTNTFMLHIPYRGAGPALNDVLGNQVPVMIDIMASSLPHIKAGKLRPIAVTSAARSSLLPQVPSIAETLPGFEVSAWHGIAVAANTPKPIVERLNAELIKIFSDTEVKTRWAEIGSANVAGKPEAFAALIKSESVRMADVVKRSGAQPD
jgi:tripartite-type tricarboxylate transporter receptor subunit TctC